MNSSGELNNIPPCSTRMMPPPAVLERRLRPQQDQPLKCPRCDSTHTKFCYYNNYSLSQPRYFCKTCRRYWTKGGSLRNIPVGGGCRKNNKRPPVNGGKKPMHQVTAPEIRHHPPLLLDQGQYHLLNTTLPTASFFGEQRGSGLLPPITQRDLASFMECKYDVSMYENPDVVHHQNVAGDVDRYGPIIANPAAQFFSCSNNSNIIDGYGDMATTVGYHGMSPLGFSMNGSSNHQPSLISTALSFDGSNESVHAAGDTKPNGKLLSMEWQDSGRDVGFNAKWTSWDNFHI